jgi:hypothetical protein
MSKQTLFWVVGSFVGGILIAAILAEAAFRYIGTAADRGPQRIELIIPAGTSDRVARGEALPGLPDPMVFVVGDTLVVKNQDSTAHQLGPLWVPAGSSASLSFDQAQNFAFACSFIPGNYLGLDVKEPLTLSTRIVGILSAGIPLGMLLSLYIVFAVLPARKAKPA